MQFLNNVLAKLRDDAHMPIAILVFAVVSVYHFYTGKDLGTNYTNVIYGTYGFLATHKFVNDKFGGDPPNGGVVPPGGSK